jgi:hypothetical protein
MRYLSERRLLVSKKHRITIIVVFSVILIAAVVLLIMSLSGRGNLLLPVGTRAEFVGNTKDYPTMISVKGNKLVDESGEQVILKGVTVPESQTLNKEKNFTEDYFKEVFSLGGNAVRVPISPENYYEDDYYLWRYLDYVVTWAGENDKYVILDWEYSGNPVDGSGEDMPDLDVNPLDYSATFWDSVATYFKNTPNVIYEIYSEPAGMTATEWQRCAQALAGVIRDSGAKQLILVGSPDYSYDLSWIDELEFSDTNFAYSMHVYPDRTFWKKTLSEYVASTPIVVTSWGVADDDVKVSDDKYEGSVADFGQSFSDYLEDNDIGWTASNYSDRQQPAMFTKKYKEKTKWGELVASLLSK